MVLFTCPRCGSKVGDPDGICPNCGLTPSETALPPSDPTPDKSLSIRASGLPFLVGAVVVAGIVALVWSIDHHMTKTPINVTTGAVVDEKANEARFHEAGRLAMLGDIVLHQAQPLPDGYKLDKATLMEDDAICYYYHALNDAGDVIAQTAVLTPEGKMEMGDTPTKQVAWSESCGRGAGVDVTPRWRAGP